MRMRLQRKFISSATIAAIQSTLRLSDRPHFASALARKFAAAASLVRLLTGGRVMGSDVSVMQKRRRVPKSREKTELL